MSTVLVTGASGYLGSHLCKKLKREGFNVIGYDCKPPKHRYMDIFYEGDIRRKSSLLDLFSRVKIDTVFHLAGRIEVSQSWEYPNEFMDVNTAGTCNLLNVMTMFRVILYILPLQVSMHQVIGQSKRMVKLQKIIRMVFQSTWLRLPFVTQISIT